MTVTANDLIVNRSDFAKAQCVTSEHPNPPEPGTCLLKIDQFALTANNVTYAVAGDSLSYWDFFPTAEDGFGRVPVWGFADVIASGHPQVAEGTRLYGYLPMSTHLTIRPGRISERSMLDISEHRKPMSPIYNQYLITATDPGWAPQSENTISLYRPLFTTSFLLDDLHQEQGFFGADMVILSSASSKTALGLAYLLARRGTVRVVGLTSPANRAFVESLGCYDQVVGYDSIRSLGVSPAAFVDMAGDADVLSRVHSHFADELKNSCRVGLTHWKEADPRQSGLPGPRPEFFFAPSYAQQRLEEWGQDGFQSRLSDAWSGFVRMVEGRIAVTTGNGPQSVSSHWQDMVSGQVDPSRGLILSMWD